MGKNRLAKMAIGGMLGLAVLAGVGAVGVLAVENVRAEEAGSTSSSMIISPMNQQIVLTPGETYTGSIKVTNPANATRPLEYTASVGSFSQKDDGSTGDDYGVVDTTSVSSYNQIMNWIKIDEPQGVVQPNETKTFVYEIVVPENAPAGGQYATILFQNDSAEKMDESSGNVNIRSKFQMASIIYADVAGETREEGQILENNVPGFLLSGPLKATSLVENDGNVHAMATYVLQVWPLFSDEEICTNEEKPESSLILPETKQYHVESCDLGIAGIYKVKQTVKIFGETSEMEATVILCPIWLIVAILVVIAAVVTVIVMAVRKRKKFSV